MLVRLLRVFCFCSSSRSPFFNWTNHCFFINNLSDIDRLIDRTPALSSPAQTENGSGNNQRSKDVRPRRPPITTGASGGGGGGGLKLGKPMKLQRIVSQTPAEDFETLTAEAPQRTRQDPMASASTGGGGMGERTGTARAPRKLNRGEDDNDKPGFTSGGRYATERLANSNSCTDVEIGVFRLLFISRFSLRFCCCSVYDYDFSFSALADFSLHTLGKILPFILPTIS